MPRTVLNSPLGKYPLALGGAGVRRAIRRDHPQFNSVLDFSSYTPLKSPLRYAKGDASHFHKAAMQYLFDQIDPTSSQPMVTFRHNKDLLADTAATLFNVLQPVGKMGAAATTKSQSSVTLMNALATTGALLSESKHRSRTYLEDDERALVSEFVVGFANAFLSQPSSSPVKLPPLACPPHGFMPRRRPLGPPILPFSSAQNRSSCTPRHASSWPHTPQALWRPFIVQ